MKKIHQTIFNVLAFTLLFTVAVNAQTTKEKKERIIVNNEFDLYVNTSHANVKFENWERNEVEVTFKMEASEEIEKHFQNWTFSVDGDQNKVTINSELDFNFNMEGFDFDIDMKDLNIDMDALDLKMEELDLNLEELDLNLDALDFGNLDVMVEDVMAKFNFDAMPKPPFEEGVNFDRDKYQKDPEGYLRKINEKLENPVTRKEVDTWLESFEVWSENFEFEMENSFDFEQFENRMSEQTKKYEEQIKAWEERNSAQIEEMTERMEEQMKAWEERNGGKLEEMTKRIEEQMEQMNFEQFERMEQFNYFDQENSDVKKTIIIKIPKGAKLHLNVRYGEVTLADNSYNVNAELNYASLVANTIQGNFTDISASFAPVRVNHWQEGALSLNHCRNTKIEKAEKIRLNAEGTDIFIGTLLNSAQIKSAYGNLQIESLGEGLAGLSLFIDYGNATIKLDQSDLDIDYTAKGKSLLSTPGDLQVLSDQRSGEQRTLKAYHQKKNSGNTLAINANYSNLTIE